MVNVIIIAVIAIIISLAGGYIHNAKKRGAKCIGCPSGCSCNGKCGSCGHSKKPDEPAVS